MCIARPDSGSENWPPGQPASASDICTQDYGKHLMTLSRLALALLISLTLSSCIGVRLHDRAGRVPLALTSCQRSESVMQKTTLYFAATHGNGSEVSLLDWNRFLAAVITPRFPAGLSWIAAQGQWQNAEGIVTREPSRLLVLIHDKNAEAETRIGEIIAAYKQQFDQQSVLRERASVCAAF